MRANPNRRRTGQIPDGPSGKTIAERPTPPEIRRQVPAIGCETACVESPWAVLVDRLFAPRSGFEAESQYFLAIGNTALDLRLLAELLRLSAVFAFRVFHRCEWFSLLRQRDELRKIRGR